MSKVMIVNVELAKQQLKDAPKELQDYVKALESACENWSQMRKKEIKKIKELSKDKS